jgi:signal transduction histidine kinase
VPEVTFCDHDLRHMSPPTPATYAAVMTNRGLERLGSIAGLLAWAAVAVPLLADQQTPVPGWPWWVAYLLVGALFAVTTSPGLADRPQLCRRLLVPQVAAGVLLVLLNPDYGFSAIPLVMNAASAASLLGLRPTLALVAAQTLVVLLAVGRVDPAAFAVTEAAVYGGLQLFAVLMVEAVMRESRARQQLTALNAELATAHAQLAEASRTEERLRIARDLHDLVGHQLTALAVNLEVASHLADGQAAEHVERSRTIAKDLLNDARDVVGQLRERAPDLGITLRALTAAVPHPDIHLTVDETITVDDPARAQALLRCIQEIITNAVRHASADNLWIEVHSDPSGTIVRARDDGCGAAMVRPGNGLTGMRERLEQLGGDLSYRSGAGEGFGVVARLPAP